MSPTDKLRDYIKNKKLELKSATNDQKGLFTKYPFEKWCLAELEILLQRGIVYISGDSSDEWSQALRHIIQRMGFKPQRKEKYSDVAGEKIEDYYIVKVNKEKPSMENKTKKIKAVVMKESESRKFRYVGLHENSVAEVTCNDSDKYRVIKIAYMNKNNEAEAKYVYVKASEINKLSPQSFVYIIAYDNQYGNLMKQWMTIGDLKVSFPTINFFIPTQAVSILDAEESKI